MYTHMYIYSSLIHVCSLRRTIGSDQLAIPAQPVSVPGRLFRFLCVCVSVCVCVCKCVFSILCKCLVPWHTLSPSLLLALSISISISKVFFSPLSLFCSLCLWYQADYSGVYVRGHTHTISLVYLSLSLSIPIATSFSPSLSLTHTYALFLHVRLIAVARKHTATRCNTLQHTAAHWPTHFLDLSLSHYHSLALSIFPARSYTHSPTHLGAFAFALSLTHTHR